MDPEDLYSSREDLTTPEQREEDLLDPQECEIPTYSPLLRRWAFEDLADDAPEAASRRAFERRLPALGITDQILAEYRTHYQRVMPVQQRKLSKGLRSRMLRMLISCDGVDPCNLEGHLAILENERNSGVPSPVPEWYKYSTVTMGLRKIGYYGCNAAGCFRTERHDAPQFDRCSGCKVAIYCSRKCQVKDWKERHKKNCKEAGKERETIVQAGKMMQRFSDMSLTGNDGDIASMLRNAKANPQVRARCRQLKAEKKRPKDQPAPPGPDPEFF